MELRTFVTQALLDIVNGITDAQREASVGVIVPPLKQTFATIETGLSAYQLVRFEICVRVDETKGKEAKIGVVSSLIGAGMATNNAKASEHSSTLQFSVPVNLPMSMKSKEIPVNS